MNQKILKLIIIGFYNITCILQRSIRLSSTYKSRATNASIYNSGFCQLTALSRHCRMFDRIYSVNEIKLFRLNLHIFRAM